MQREVMTVPSHWSVGETIDFMRASADGESSTLPEQFYDIFVIDPARRPLGSVPLSRLLRTRRPVAITDIMDTDMKVLPVTTDQEEVAFVFRQRDLVSAPVVDDAGRLVGAITVDDVVDVIHEENEEDILLLGGVKEDDLYDATLDTTRARFAWLLVNLGTAVLASLVIGLFDATIQQMVALAILMPIVASMGGNAGTQTLTVTVRALAMKELTPTNAARVIGKEVLVGSLNGALFAVIIGVVTWFWFGDPLLGGVIGMAMVANLVVAGLAGSMIPLMLDRMGVDPAVASAVFLTTVTDVVGFFVFLGLAALVLL
jgi:magnesium transporter